MRWYLPLAVLGIPALLPGDDKAAIAVVEKKAGEVGFYSASGKRVGGVKVGTHPHEMLLSADNRYLYVSDNGILWMTDPGEGGNTISIIDVKAMKKTGVIDLGNYRRPHGLDLDRKTGRLLSTIENPDGLLLIDVASRKVVRKYDVQGTDPHMVLFGPTAEWAYVSNSASHTIAAVHLASGKVKLIPTDQRPQGGMLSRDRKLIYMTNSDGNSIALIDPLKNERVGTIATGKGPGRIAQTPDGKTLVYNLQPGEAVGFADLATRKETGQVALGGRPLSLALSADGRLAYAGVQDNDKICVVSVAERKVIQEIRTPKGAGPDTVAPLP
jgi:DNA-binding beta-propeller fold protein YncE